MPSPDEGVAPVSTNFGIDSWRSSYPDKTNPSMRIVPKLNDIGRCRYTIDGNTETEYLRWQVVRQALEPLFFPE